ncbi:MAG: T9SS type A sorting domain-containing protein [Gelidibacter sp.]
MDITTFSCADLGDNTVTLTVTDEANNSDSRTAIVTVEDNIDPVINCPSDFTVDSNGDYTLPDYVTGGQVTATDNCAASVAQTPIAGTVLADGIHEISFLVTDEKGNSVNCSFNLDVNDTTLGIDDHSLTDSSISLFPNPVKNVLIIKNEHQLELLDGQIMDVTGKVITAFDLKNMAATKEISLGNYASGMYFVKINGMNSSITKRIVKQ